MDRPPGRDGPGRTGTDQYGAGLAGAVRGAMIRRVAPRRAGPVAPPRGPSGRASGRSPAASIGAVGPSGASPIGTANVRDRAAHALSEAVRGRHVRAWVVAVLAVALAGTLGYALLFGWSLSDAAYMTVMTLTTVGFREVREIAGVPERAWTMLLAISGVGDHLRVDRHRRRDDPERGRERPAGGEADARGGRGATGPLHRVRLRPGRLDGRPGAGPVRPAAGRDRHPRLVAGAGGGGRPPGRRGRCHRRRDPAGGRAAPAPEAWSRPSTPMPTTCTSRCPRGR